MLCSVPNFTYVGVPIHALILLRGAWVRLWKVYPLFYFQLACSLVASNMAFWIFLRHPASYFEAYWNAQILTMLTACCSLLELSRQGFRGGGVPDRRFGRSIFCFVCLLAANGGALYWALFRGKAPSRALQAALVAFERDFRLIQALILLVLLAGLFYFGLPLGRNLKGIFFGYGIYVGSSLLTLALEARFLRWFYPFWAVLQPASYLASLLIYLFYLWSYQPAVAPSLALSVAYKDDNVIPILRA